MQNWYDYQISHELTKWWSRLEGQNGLLLLLDHMSVWNQGSGACKYPICKWHCLLKSRSRPRVKIGSLKVNGLYWKMVPVQREPLVYFIFHPLSSTLTRQATGATIKCLPLEAPSHNAHPNCQTNPSVKIPPTFQYFQPKESIVLLYSWSVEHYPSLRQPVSNLPFQIEF